MTKNLRKLADLRAEAANARDRIRTGRADITVETAQRDLRRTQDKIVDVVESLSTEELATYEKELRNNR